VRRMPERASEPRYERVASRGDVSTSSGTVSKRARACSSNSWFTARWTADAQVMVVQEGSRPKAPTSSSAHGQPAAMRTVRRRAEETRSPALCRRV